MTTEGTTAAPRHFSREEFDRVYTSVVLHDHFVEEPAYYRQHRSRYRNTLRLVSRLPLAAPADILEIGGGQIALLASKMYGDRGTVADLSEQYAEAVRRHDLSFRVLDLFHDRITPEPKYDLIVLCEVIEHMPVPPYIVLERLRTALRPGGFIFLTTPNLYRFRNLVRLALGKPVFSTFFYPERGQGIGHPLEYSAGHLRWQLERAGYEVLFVEHHQLSNRGASPAAHIGRLLSAPLFLRPLWRDGLVAAARSPGPPAGPEPQRPA